MSPHDAPDVLIAGGSSAGMVLAARLSEDPHRRVLLLEAGPFYRLAEFPEILADASRTGGDVQHDWEYASEPGVVGHPIHVIRGKVLGGSSAVNAAVAMGHLYDPPGARPAGRSSWPPQ